MLGDLNKNIIENVGKTYFIVNLDNTQTLDITSKNNIKYENFIFKEKKKG